MALRGRTVAERYADSPYNVEREENGMSTTEVMYSKFDLHIDLGNEAMRSGLDVAAALREVADKIERDLEATGAIRDANGNTVGKYGPSN